MTAARTPAQRGTANRRKGAAAERAVACYLRGNGWPHTERAVKTGFRAGARVGADPGDLTGTPGICWQVTDRADLDQDGVLARRMADTAAQTAAAGADLGLLVQRRRGHADPGGWWCWLRLADLVPLIDPDLRAVDGDGAPLRMALADVVALLRARGYGDPPSTHDTRPETRR